MTKLAPPQKTLSKKLGLLATFVASIVGDITLNKFSSTIPGWRVLALWLLPLLFFFLWLGAVLQEQSWLKDRYRKSPVTTILTGFLLLGCLMYGTILTTPRLLAWTRDSPPPAPHPPSQFQKAPSDADTQRADQASTSNDRTTQSKQAPPPKKRQQNSSAVQNNGTIIQSSGQNSTTQNNVGSSGNTQGVR